MRVFRRDEAVRLRETGMPLRKIAAELQVPVTTVVEGPVGGYLPNPTLQADGSMRPVTLARHN